MSTAAIQVDHINIRLSISFLILKLTVIEVVHASLLFTLSLAFYNIQFPLNMEALGILYSVVFLLLVIIKLYLSALVVLQWLNEYYEITPQSIHYRRGLFHKHTERYSWKEISLVEYQQEILGTLLNYGTLHLYIWTLNKHFYMYMIHNPKRYLSIINNLLPQVSETKETLREHIIEEESNST